MVFSAIGMRERPSNSSSWPPTHFMLFRLDIKNMTAQLVSPVICTAMISTVVMRDATQGDVSDHGDVDDMVMVPALGSEYVVINFISDNPG